MTWFHQFRIFLFPSFHKQTSSEKWNKFVSKGQYLNLKSIFSWNSIAQKTNEILDKICPKFLRLPIFNLERPNMPQKNQQRKRDSYLK
jgi:hypothetical protein